MKSNDWKERLGVTYSTDPDFEYRRPEAYEEETLPADRQLLRVSLDRRRRGGKTVTLVAGFRGSDADLQALGRMLRIACGAGGSAGGGEILVQGDFCRKILDILFREGYVRSKII
ncbi:MAG: translation initiation factor [Tannerella sp.]|jgi:translation initiation factor 1|nr:translation initiation factor [Tannerella sp.]